MPFIQLLEIPHILNLKPACGPAIVKNSDRFRKSQSVPFLRYNHLETCNCLGLTKTIWIKMENLEEKSTQNGVGIIYNLSKYTVKLILYGAQGHRTTLRSIHPAYQNIQLPVNWT